MQQLEVIAGLSTEDAKNQLIEREQVQFPPYIYTALLRAEANHYAPVSQLLQYAFQVGRALNKEVMIYEPVRPQMERIKGMERGHILLQARQRGPLQFMLKNLVNALRNHKQAAKIRWSVDVDPLEF